MSTRESVWNAMNAPADDPLALSTAGAARRESILTGVSLASRRRRSRRVALRGAGVFVIVVGAGMGAWIGFGGGATAPAGHGDREIAAQLPADPAPTQNVAREAPAPVRIDIVTTDPGILSRYAAAAPAVEEVSDEQLLEVMKQLGRPTGIVRVKGSVMLTADMTEADPRRPTSMSPDADGPVTG